MTAKDAAERLATILDEEFGELVSREDSLLSVNIDGTRVYILLIEAKEADPPTKFIEILGEVWHDLEYSPNALRWLIKNGPDFFIGTAVATLCDESMTIDVDFRVRLVAEDMNAAEVGIATRAVAESARELMDQMSDELGDAMTSVERGPATWANRDRWIARLHDVPYIRMED